MPILPTMVRRISDEILHRIVAPEEGDVVSVVTPENAREIADEASRAIAALIAEREAVARKEGCAWADAIERWFVEWEMLPDWSAADPWAELHRMICWEQQVALDPAVSEDARKLIAEERARAFEEAVGAFNSVGHLMSRGEIIAAIRTLAKKETPDAE